MKKKFTFLAFLLCILCGLNPLKAQETVTIGEGGYQSENDKFPLYTYYEYSVSQQIYTADDLDAIGAGAVIKSIAFNVTFAGAPNIERAFSIYLKNTTKDEFSSTSDYETIDNSNLVYTVPDANKVKFNATGWYTFNFDTPFTYTGDNLLICVHDYSNNYESSTNFSLNSTGDKKKSHL